MLAWHSLRADRDAACVLMGMTSAVADLIHDVPLPQLDEIAGRQFRHVQPRWQEQPAIWRALLNAAQSSRDRPMREFNLYALQLVAGALLSAQESNRAEAHPSQRQVHSRGQDRVNADLGHTRG